MQSSQWLLVSKIVSLLIHFHVVVIQNLIEPWKHILLLKTLWQFYLLFLYYLGLNLDENLHHKDMWSYLRKGLEKDKVLDKGLVLLWAAASGAENMKGWLDSLFNVIPNVDVTFNTCSTFLEALTSH